jgi:hypothetical protein
MEKRLYFRFALLRLPEGPLVEMPAAESEEALLNRLWPCSSK